MKTLYGLTLPLTVSPYERVFMAPYGSRVHSHSLSRSRPATLTLLPLFTSLEVLPLQVEKTEMTDSYGIEDSRPDEILVAQQLAAKESEALIGTEGIASCLAPFICCFVWDCSLR